MCKVGECLKTLLKMPHPFPKLILRLVICNRMFGKLERGG